MNRKYHSWVTIVQRSWTQRDQFFGRKRKCICGKFWCELGSTWTLQKVIDWLIIVNYCTICIRSLPRFSLITRKLMNLPTSQLQTFNQLLYLPYFDISIRACVLAHLCEFRLITCLTTELLGVIEWLKIQKLVLWIKTMWKMWWFVHLNDVKWSNLVIF